MAHIRKGDEVLVIAGRDKGQRGTVLRTIPEKGRLIVEGVNIVKRHTKPTTANPQGGILSKPAAIHESNVQLWSDDQGGGGRVGVKFVGEGGTHYDRREEAKASFGDSPPPRIEKMRVVKPSKREL